MKPDTKPSNISKLIALPTLTLLGLFTILDLLAGAFYWLYLQELVTSRFFNLSRDRGLAEIVQYLKYILIIIILLRWYKVRQEHVIKAWAIFFVVLLLDDALGLHEFLGKLLLPLMTFDLPTGMRAKDLAEIGGFALLEGIALLHVFFCFLKSRKDLRWYSVYLFCALLPMIFAGLVLDNLPLEVMEQAGEMLGASIVLVFVHWHYNTFGNTYSNTYGAKTTSACKPNLN